MWADVALQTGLVIRGHVREAGAPPSRRRGSTPSATARWAKIAATAARPPTARFAVGGTARGDVSPERSSLPGMRWWTARSKPAPTASDIVLETGGLPHGLRRGRSRPARGELPRPGAHAAAHSHRRRCPRDDGTTTVRVDLVRGRALRGGRSRSRHLRRGGQRARARDLDGDETSRSPRVPAPTWDGSPWAQAASCAAAW
jgi:hypothetical protein